MESRTSVVVDRLSKEYEIGSPGGRYRTLRETVSKPFSQRRKRRKAERIWALQDVSFAVPEGRVLGVIGANGAGKSTLLKIVSRITEPTSGSIELRGRVGALLEVGTGFHPELTGRENVYLNGAILGMKRVEIAARFDAIVAFSEVQKFLDTPVKFYSSGMHMRLAFSVAAYLEPEILLIDEVLAVGDAAFQKKCLGKMGEVAKEGRTVLFVSHNLAAVENLCDEVLVLKSGRVDVLGAPREAINRYLGSTTEAAGASLLARQDRRGNGAARFESIDVRPFGSAPRIATGHDLEIEVILAAKDPEVPPRVNLDVALHVRDARGSLITTFANFFTGQAQEPVFIDGRWALSCRVPKLPLLEGTYRIGVWCGQLSELVDLVEDAVEFIVEPGNYFSSSDARQPEAGHHGYLVLPQAWDSGLI